MALPAVISLLCALICFSLAHFVSLGKATRSPDKIASVLIVSFSLWAFLDFFFQSSQNGFEVVSWYTIYFLKFISVPLCFHFVLTRIRIFKKEKNEIILLVVYTVTVLAVVLTLFFSDTVAVNNNRLSTIMTKARLWVVTRTISATVLGSCLVMVLLHIRKALHAKTRRQFLLIFFGVSLLMICSLMPLQAHAVAPEALLLLIPILQTGSAVFFSIAVLYQPFSLLSPSDAAEIIVRTMSDSLVVVNMDRKIEIVNNALLQSLGYSEQELIGKRPEVIIGRFENRDDSSVTRLLRSGVVSDVRTYFRKKSGDSIPVSLSWSVLREDDQKIIGIVFIGRDMSERERVQAELEKASAELERRIEMRTQELKNVNEQLEIKIEEQVKFERQLHAEKEWLAVTLHSIGDGVITIDSTGHITMMNPAAEQLTGWLQREAVGKYINEVYLYGKQNGEEDKSAIHTISTLINGTSNKPISTQSVIVSKDGVTLTVAESASPIIDSNGERIGFVLTVSDITERVLLEKEFFRARKLESITLLAGGIAHDFNNLLTSIVTNLFMAKMELNIDSEIAHLITNAEKAAFHASNLAMQLLHFSQSTIPCKEKIAIREVIENSVGFYLSISKSDYKLEFADELWDIMIDRGQIDLVLNNIIGNADEAMPDGGTIVVKVENFTLEQSQNLPLKKGKYVKISVSDDGVGIEENMIYKIFDPYFTTRENASGLGLTTAFVIVQKHGGHITVESVKNEGTTFSIYLPAVDNVPTEASTTIDTGQTDSHGIVLLMDDEEIVRDSTKKVLNHLGYDVSLAENGDQALAMMRECANKSIRLLAAILDLTVHGGKGAIDIIKEIRSIDPELKIIVSSGYTNDRVMTEYQSFGFHAAISKPYKVDSLADVLREFIHPSDPEVSS